jgi:hypothetical protein
MLQDSATMALGGTILLNSPFSILKNEQATRSKVVLIRDANLLDSAGIINEKILSAMLDEAVMKLTNTTTAQSAWAGIVKPADIVG